MTQAKSYAALIVVQAQSHLGEAVLKTVVIQLASFVQFEKASSVYLFERETDPGKKIHALKAKQIERRLSVGFKVKVALTPGELIAACKKVEKIFIDDLGQRGIRIFVAAYEDQVRQTPEVVLPYPFLQELPDLLLPASESWPNYQHPILDMDLGVLARKLRAQSANMDRLCQFYSQGKALLDFLPSEE